MKIGVKYCGGCNPHYDRKKAVENLKEKLIGSSVEPVRNNEEYDKILLVCGCPRTCIKSYRSAKSKVYVLVYQERDFDNIDRRGEKDGLVINNRSNYSIMPNGGIDF